jgi:hypothetical protein
MLPHVVGVCTTNVFLTAPRCPAHDTAFTAAVALGADFTPEPRAVATAFGPAAGEESLKGRDIARLLRLVVRGRPVSLEPAVNARRTGADGATDSLTGQAKPL